MLRLLPHWHIYCKEVGYWRQTHLHSGPRHEHAADVRSLARSAYRCQLKAVRPYVLPHHVNSNGLLSPVLLRVVATYACCPPSKSDDL